MFPAVARYDECERGMVEHALRLCVAKTRKEYIYPANAFCILDFGHIDKLSGDGSAPAPQVQLRDSE